MWDTYQASLALAVVLVSLVLVWRSWCPASLMDCACKAQHVSGLSCWENPSSDSRQGNSYPISAEIRCCALRERGVSANTSSSL